MPLRDGLRRLVQPQGAAGVAQPPPGPQHVRARRGGEVRRPRPARQPLVPDRLDAGDRGLLQHELADEHAPRGRARPPPGQVAGVDPVPVGHEVGQRHGGSLPRAAGGRRRAVSDTRRGRWPTLTCGSRWGRCPPPSTGGGGSWRWPRRWRWSASCSPRRAARPPATPVPAANRVLDRPAAPATTPARPADAARRPRGAVHARDQGRARSRKGARDADPWRRHGAPGQHATGRSRRPDGTGAVAARRRPVARRPSSTRRRARRPPSSAPPARRTARRRGPRLGPARTFSAATAVVGRRPSPSVAGRPRHHHRTDPPRRHPAPVGRRADLRAGPGQRARAVHERDALRRRGARPARAPGRQPPRAAPGDHQHQRRSPACATSTPPARRSWSGARTG